VSAPKENSRPRPVGLLLASGLIIRPDGAPANPADRARWTWRCPGCGLELSGEVRECLVCNAALVDPDRVLERDAQLHFLTRTAAGGAARVSAVRIG